MEKTLHRERDFNEDLKETKKIKDLNKIKQQQKLRPINNLTI